jgi:beta-ribofuranosylaminobenzene 5'-phosphate synthase
MAKRRVRVTAAPRLHMGLIDLSDVSLRRYGGLGLAIEGPAVNVGVEEAEELSVVDFPQQSYPDLALQPLLSRIIQARGSFGATIWLENVPPAHSGLGTKTSNLLSLLTALNTLFEWNLTPDEIQLLSGRGGTSGIGVHSFFHGGFIVDSGHEAAGEYRPSRLADGFNIPLLQIQSSFPIQWVITLIMPEGNRISGAEEADFFRRHTPIPALESYRTFAAVYHGVVPAVLSHNLGLLRDALWELNNCGFKQIEIAEQSDSVLMILSELRAVAGTACGMSSMGPLVYCIHERNDGNAADACRLVAARYRALVLGTWSAWNDGARIDITCA